MTIRARSIALLVLAVTAIALTACGGGSSASSPSSSPLTESDPAAPGPYAVGVTTMTFGHTSPVDGAARSLDTRIRYPAAAASAAGRTPTPDIAPAEGGPFPVVIFSHGSGGQPYFYTFLTEHLALWGFVVVAPTHPGDTSADCSPCSGASIIASARERPGDIAFILDRISALPGEASQPLGKIIDPSRIAIAGHSFGGWTALFAGTDPRFSAIVAMAPGLPDTLTARAAGITAPVLLLGGSKDELVSPASVARLDAALPAATTTYVSFPEGHHNTFHDSCTGCTDALPAQRGHDLANRYATAFLETYVIKDERYAHYLAEDVAPDALIVHDPP